MWHALPEQAQQALGRRVSELHFQASPHVQHMRVHADLYTATIASFLAELPQQELARKPDLKVCALPAAHCVFQGACTQRTVEVIAGI